MKTWFKKLLGIKPKPPTNLEEALLYYDETLDGESRNAILSTDNMATFHLTAGMSLRNRWKLWSGGPLVDWFNALGIDHPDDMSSIILDALHCRLKKIPFDLDSEVKKYKEYWLKVKIADQNSQSIF